MTWSSSARLLSLLVVVACTSDSIVVHDYPNFRITVLAPDGSFGRHAPVPQLPDGTPVLIEDVFGDGSLLVTPMAGGPPSGQGLTRRERPLW